MISDLSLDTSFDSIFLYLMFFIITEFFIRKEERLREKYFKHDWIAFSLISILILEKFGGINSFIYFQF